MCQSIIAVDRIYWAFTAYVPRPDEVLILEDRTKTRVKEVKYEMGGTKLALVPVVAVAATGRTKDRSEDLLAFLSKAVGG